MTQDAVYFWSSDLCWCGLLNCGIPMAIRVLFTGECFRQRSGHMDRPVKNVRAILHKYKMRLVPIWGPRLCDDARSVLDFLGGRNNQHVDHATTSSLFSRVEVQMSCCVIEQTATDTLSLSRCPPAETYRFKTFVKRSNRAQHTKHRDSSDVAQAL